MDEIDVPGRRRMRIDDGGSPGLPPGGAGAAPLLAGQCLWREHRHTRVLIADGAGQLRRQAQPPLELAGLKVDAARDGERAAALAGRAEYGLVLLHLGLAEPGPFELVRRLRRLPARRPMSILGVCTHSSAGTRQRCLEAGFDDCIATPFGPETLFAAALRLLRRPASPLVS